MTRLSRFAAAALAAVFATLVGAAVLALPFLSALVEWGAERQLSALMGKPAALDVAELGLHGARIERLALGDAVRAETAELRWTLPGLLRGTIDSVTVTRMSAHVVVEPNGVVFPSLDALFGPGEASLKPTNIRVADSTLHLHGPWGDIALAIDAKADPQGILITAETGDGRIELSARTDLDGSAGQFLLEAPWAHGVVDFTLGEDVLTLVAPKPLAVRLEHLPDWLGPFVPGALAPALQVPLRLAVSGIGGTPAELRMALGADGPSEVNAALYLQLDAGTAVHAKAEMDGTATLAGSAPPHLSVRRFSTEARNWPLEGATLDGILSVAQYDGTSAQGEADAHLRVTARDVRAQGGTLENAALSLGGRLRVEGPRLSLTLDKPGTLYLAGMRLGATVATLEPASLALGSGATATIELERAAAGLVTVIPDLPIEGRMRLAVGGIDIDTDARGHVQGAWAFPDGPHLPVVTVSGATLHSNDLGLVARDVDAVYTLGQDGPAGNLDIGEVRRRAGGQEGVALAGSAQLRTRAGQLDYSAALTGVGGNVRIAVEGRHDPVSGRGSARIAMPPATFGPDLRPRDLFPTLAHDAGEASGTVAVNGTVQWRPGNSSSDLKVTVRDYSGMLGGVALGRLNTTLRITGLSPLQTPPDQSLSVALVDAGLPLLDGVMTYGIDRGELVVAAARTHLAGGLVRLGRTRLDFADGREQFLLDVDGVDLSRLISMIELDGLQATGSLAGKIPLSLAGDAVSIDGATLVSTVPGVLRYRPNDPPSGIVGAGESMELLLRALDDFHYEELIMTLNGRTGGELVATMKIKGANPALYGGYPIEFNLNVSGKLGTILDDAVSSYRIPDRIRERMSEFGAR